MSIFNNLSCTYSTYKAKDTNIGLQERFWYINKRTAFLNTSLIFILKRIIDYFPPSYDKQNLINPSAGQIIERNCLDKITISNSIPFKPFLHKYSFKLNNGRTSL